jgi:hypothetical protein
VIVRNEEPKESDMLSDMLSPTLTPSKLKHPSPTIGFFDSPKAAASFSPSKQLFSSPPAVDEHRTLDRTQETVDEENAAVKVATTSVEVASASVEVAVEPVEVAPEPMEVARELEMQPEPEYVELALESVEVALESVEVVHEAVVLAPESVETEANTDVPLAEVELAPAGLAQEALEEEKEEENRVEECCLEGLPCSPAVRSEVETAGAVDAAASNSEEHLATPTDGNNGVETAAANAERKIAFVSQPTESCEEMEAMEETEEMEEEISPVRDAPEMVMTPGGTGSTVCGDDPQERGPTGSPTPEGDADEVRPMDALRLWTLLL